MDDFKEQMNLADKAITAMDSAAKGIGAIQDTIKEMNDQFILHNKVAMDTNKMVKDLLIWIVKVLVVAIIVLAGAKAVFDFI